MKKTRNFGVCLMVFVVMLVVLITGVWAQEKFRLPITLAEFEKHKKPYDDPRPFLTEGPYSYKNILPPEVYRKLTYDVEKMKNAWADVVGFKAPDVVGKIAPEIKPGIYSYKDKEKFPGLKELMIPEMYNRFKPGGPPLGGNFPEIKVVSTRQYYYPLPITEGTKKYEGQAKLDNEGYLITESYNAGHPFPRPSEKFRAQQIMYNWDKRYYLWESYYRYQFSDGFTKNLKCDRRSMGEIWQMRLQGRLQMEPLGWFDERAQKKGEAMLSAVRFLAPRDLFGGAFSILYYADSNTLDYYLIYASAIRRIRTMSTTDTQDAVGGSDLIFEDREHFSQKLSPTRYPYKFKMIAEREYLVPSLTLDGSLYFTSKELELRNVEFERRPVYVVELTQMDKNYVYGKRIFYIDKETFLLLFIENYDQKGRLYRSATTLNAFIPEMGNPQFLGAVQLDHIDLHSTLVLCYNLPAPWLGRENVNLQSIISRGK